MPQHDEVAAEVADGWARVLERGDFVLGEDVGRFEAEFADFCGIARCVGVANGTDALELALRALGVGQGDGVLVPANSFIASALAIRRAGADPIFVDVSPDTHLLDLTDAQARITARTRAIVPVHLFGQLAPMEDVQAFARTHDLVVVEDAAQCQGATRHSAGAGSWGAAAGTSFYPGKNLGAYGDGGAVLTDVAETAARLRALRNYGSERKYEHLEAGFNSRLDTLQAVVLRAKLARLADWNAARSTAAARYHDLLSYVNGVELPVTLAGNEHVWHLYVVRVHRRDRTLERVQRKGIMAGVHYPVPIHLQPAFADLGHRRGDFPETERAADEIISLPLFPHISERQQQRVVDCLRAALED